MRFLGTRIGTRFYLPALQKYFVMEDDCPECDTATVYVNPPSTGLTVNTTPLFNTSTNTCF